jgi:acyl-CoA thioester hydrolase
MSQPHIVHLRVYYEDTDAGGIVYHTNYLKFAERARTEWLRDKGFEQSALLKEGLAFVVSRLESDFLAPARLDDRISVETRLQEAGKVRMKIRQVIKRDEKELVRLTVTVASLRDGKAVRLPEGIV